jgi:hypothetical protein
MGQNMGYFHLCAGGAMLACRLQIAQAERSVAEKNFEERLADLISDYVLFPGNPDAAIDEVISAIDEVISALELQIMALKDEQRAIASERGDANG